MVTRLLLALAVVSALSASALHSQPTTVVIKQSYAAGRVETGAILRVAPNGGVFIGLTAQDASPELLAVAAFVVGRTQERAKHKNASVLLQVYVSSGTSKASSELLPWARNEY